MRQLNANGGTILDADELDEIDEFVTREILTSDVLSGHKADLSKFKNAAGDFTRWVHIFHVSERPTFHDTNLRTTHVLPWCWDSDTLDLEFHRAVAALNGYVNYPLAWKSMSWALPAQENTPIYSLFAPNPSQQAMHAVIRNATGFEPKRLHDSEGTEQSRARKEQEFWTSMEQFLLVPRKDGGVFPRRQSSVKPINPSTRSYSDASIGLSQASPPTLREWGHDTSYWSPRMRKVPGDRE